MNARDVAFHAQGRDEALRHDPPRTGLRAERLWRRWRRENGHLHGLARLRSWWRARRFAIEAERREADEHAPVGANY